LINHTDISVCHLTSVHPPFDIRIFYKECISLAKAGYVVTLVAPIDKVTDRLGIKVVPIVLPKSRLKRMMVVNWRMFRLAIKQKASIYHFHDPEIMPCGVLLRCAGKKVIFDVHENIRLSIQSKEWLYKSLKPVIRGLYYLTERFSMCFFNHLILAEDSYLAYYPKYKSTVVLNYPIFKNIEPKSNKSIQPVKLIYSGVIHELRGICEMLLLVKLLTDHKLDVTLTLVGEVRPPSLKSELEKWINVHGLDKQIIYMGKVDYLKVSDYLNEATIGLSLLKPIANYTGSLPTKIFEYMQHELPVIANNFGLIQSYVDQEGVGICIDIDRIEDDLNKIIELVKSATMQKQMGERGKILTRDRWNWASQEEKLIQVYHQLEVIK